MFSYEYMNIINNKFVEHLFGISKILFHFQPVNYNQTARLVYRLQYQNKKEKGTIKSWNLIVTNPIQNLQQLKYFFRR